MRRATQPSSRAAEEPHTAARGSTDKKPASPDGRREKRATRMLWVSKVTTDSTHPPAGLFTKDARTIARSLASRKVSPKEPVSGLRMLIYFINRGGEGLTATRRRELEKAKQILSQQIANDHASSGKTI